MYRILQIIDSRDSIDDSIRGSLDVVKGYLGLYEFSSRYGGFDTGNSPYFIILGSDKILEPSKIDNRWYQENFIRISLGYISSLLNVISDSSDDNPEYDREQNIDYTLASIDLTRDDILKIMKDLAVHIVERDIYYRLGMYPNVISGFIDSYMYCLVHNMRFRLAEIRSLQYRASILPSGGLSKSITCAIVEKIKRNNPLYYGDLFSDDVEMLDAAGETVTRRLAEQEDSMLLDF